MQRFINVFPFLKPTQRPASRVLNGAQGKAEAMSLGVSVAGHNNNQKQGKLFKEQVNHTHLK